MNRPILVAAVLFASAAAPAGAKTLHVPGDWPKIQVAINQSAHGDTVLVAPGTYFEQIAFLGKAITVMSSHGAQSTAIDAMISPHDYGSVVYFTDGEGNDSVLCGFTLTGGTGTRQNWDTYGGAVYCEGGSPVIRECIILKNEADKWAGFGYGFGGGIFCDGANPVIEDNIILFNTCLYGGGIYCSGDDPMISGNTVFSNNASSGGGIYCSGSHPVVRDNNVYDNVALSIPQQGGGGINCEGDYPLVAYNHVHGNLSGSGGGIYCSGNYPVVTGNLIEDNTAWMLGFSGFGGGLWLGDHYPDFTQATVTNNIIRGNHADDSGGGVYLGPWYAPLSASDSASTLTNNTIIHNTAGYGGGGGVWSDGTKPVIVNTILFGNGAPQGKEIYLRQSTLTISHSDVEGGQGSVHLYGSSMNWGAGMIDADPAFVDAAGDDVHLAFDSPCKGAGNNRAPQIPTEDFEGDPRIAFGLVDMGADEFHDHLYYTGDAVPGGSIQVKFTGVPGTAPTWLILGAGVHDPPIPSMWGDWYLKTPLIGPIILGTLPAPKGVLVLPGTLPAAPAGPYAIPMQGLIGTQLTNLCILQVDW